MGEVSSGDLIVQFTKANLHLVDKIMQPFMGQFRHRRRIQFLPECGEGSQRRLVSRQFAQTDFQLP